MVLQGDVTNKNHYISTTRVPMVTKFGSMVTCLDGFLPIKSKDPLSILFSTVIVAIFTILSRTVTSPEGPISISHINVCHVVLPDHMTNENHCISITRVVMASKLVKMVNYPDGLLSIKPHEPLITWSCEITRQTKTIISSLSQCL